MLPRLLTSIALATSVLAPGAVATTSHSSAPMGFLRYELSAGLQTVGFPLLNTAAATGTVHTTDATSLFAAEDNVIGARLDPACAYYLEFTAGPASNTAFVGDRFEVDVARTTDAGNPANRIRLQLGSTFSTLRVVPAELAGYRFVIRPHVTLAGVLGTGVSCALQSGFDTASADQVYLLHNGNFQSYLFQADPTTGERRWVKFPEGNVADDLPIAPGMGLFIRHVGGRRVTLHHLGDVRTNAFVQPLIAGQSLVSEPFPVENSFETRGMTAVNGFTAGERAEAADNVSVWTGESYRTLYFTTNSGTGPTWRSADTTAQSTASENVAAFSPWHAVLVQKLAADPDYIVPSPL